MRRYRPSGLAVMATVFVVAGFALMLASLGIESTRGPSTDDAAAGVVVPTAAAATTTAAVAASDPAATRLFARAQAANRTLAYGGIKQVSRWTKGKQSTVVLTVDHVPGHGTLVAEGASADLAADQAGATFTVEPAADDETAMLDTLVRNYRLVAGPSVPVLGRTTTELEAYRGDGTIAARFWIDNATGLVLRRELVASDGSPTETASYTKVELAPHVEVTPTATAAAWSVVDDSGVATLRAEGWNIPAVLADGQSLYQVREQTQSGATTLQLSYTDGLVGISVFQQQGVLDRDAMTGFVPVTAAGGEVWVRTGNFFFTWQSRPSSVASTSGDSSHDIVVSALADSPNAPIGAVLAVFPPLAAEDAGVGAHLSRGVQRVGSWIDPLN